jgi:phage shock protein PspC (stress-responsive transcriptional regulator)
MMSMMPETDPPTSNMPPPPTTAARPRLERPREDRLISGVCTGVARHLGIDVTIVRLVTVVLAFIGGAGLLAYLAMLALVPEEGTEQPLIRTGRLDDDDRAPLIIGALVLAAVVCGAGPLPWGPWHGGGWVVVLAVGGFLAWYTLRRDRRRDEDVAAPSGPPSATAVLDPQATAVTEPLHPGSMPPPPHGRPPRRPGGGRIVTGIILLAFGAVGLVGALVDVDLAWDTGLAIVVLGIGAGAVVAAPFGGARAILIVGFLAAALGGFAAAADVQLRGGVGERTERPIAASDLPRTYRLAVGRLEVDLRGTRFPQGTTTVRARTGMGELVIYVPRDVTVVAHAQAGLGDVEVLGDTEEGGSPDLRRSYDGAPDRRLIIEARTGLGHVEIDRDGEGS